MSENIPLQRSTIDDLRKIGITEPTLRKESDGARVDYNYQGKPYYFKSVGIPGPQGFNIPMMVEHGTPQKRYDFSKDQNAPPPPDHAGDLDSMLFQNEKGYRQILDAGAGKDASVKSDTAIATASSFRRPTAGI
jgi:hypothetical protein